METKLNRAAALSFVLLIALTSVACRGKHDRVTVQNEEPAPGSQLMSNLRMSDANAAPQLLSGFYAVENNTWRWTAGKFSVQLRTPPAAQSGATVALSFTLPDVIVQKVKGITLAASINGTELKSEHYDTPGPYVFNADVPASLLTGESIKVDFSVDKTMRPDGDKRELAIIANSVGITPK